MSAFPKLRLHYFDTKGRGEPIRVALFIGGVPFEDVRIQRKDWPAIKPTTPLGSIPFLEIDGKPIAQSNAIIRYVGKLTNLYPTDQWAAAKVDEVLDTVEDITNLIVPSLRETDNDKRQQMREAMIAPNGPLTLAIAGLEKIISEGGEYSVGNSLTIADLKLSNLVWLLRSGALDHVPKTFCDKHKRISLVTDKVFAHPKVVEWEEKTTKK
eukprot:TRINITY_DN1019_c0_g7_i2.p1 TRINITY_DN1019_c0_g7~~TRINITY_DN1019_c0_g7_i2.p1  ORF type:complete len:247 (+),score=53.61 TRINITY_DN1019_c0_g7_i2:111-743(+)